jgi:hypothetical protein
MSIENERRQRELHLGVVLSSDAKVWRYLDFPKFISLLEHSSLFFCRADLFSDKYEGSITKSSVKFRENTWRENMPSVSDEILKNLNDLQRFRLREERKKFYINCWHMNEHESAAMWELYGTKGQSIAIQSTYRTLREILPIKQSESGQPAEGHVDIGLVQYLDYENDPMPQVYSFDPFLRKRMSFSHENEVRLIYQSPPKSGSYEKTSEGEYEFRPSDGEQVVCEFGKNIEVDLSKLIKNVYVAPDCADWFRDLVSAVLRRYGLSIELCKSNLNDSPVY